MYSINLYVKVKLNINYLYAGKILGAVGSGNYTVKQLAAPSNKYPAGFETFSYY
jgi:hypothetical protein